ncbi:MAG: hypothetical protein SGBAC_010414 [Bacillariaceae sp.]
MHSQSVNRYVPLIDDLKRRNKKQESYSLEDFKIPYSHFDLFNRSSIQRSPLTQHSHFWADNIASMDSMLEPTPFENGTTLEPSSPLQGRYAVSLDHQSTTNSRRLVQDNEPRSQQHSLEGIETLSTLVLPNRSLEVSHEGDLEKASSSCLLNLMSSDVVIDKPLRSSQSQRKRARSDSSEHTQPRYRSYQNDQWDQRYQDLLKFKEKQGHCHVQHTYQENPALARWAKRQRYQYKRKLEQKQSSMSEARQHKLDEAGFIWDLQTMVWQERYAELVDYKREYGDCNVPCRFEENPPLGMWVKCQRRQYKLHLSNQVSRLTPKRFQLLTDLGFRLEQVSKINNKKMSG